MYRDNIIFSAMSVLPYCFSVCPILFGYFEDRDGEIEISFGAVCLIKWFPFSIFNNLFGSKILQQVFYAEFVIQGQMCELCHRRVCLF